MKLDEHMSCKPTSECPDMSASIKHFNNEVHSTWANAHSGTVVLLRVMLGHGHQNTWQ